MSTNKQTLKEMYLSAIENYKKKDFKSAEIYCYKILSIDPHNFESISLLSSISAVSGNFEKAKELLNQAISIQPKNLTTLHNLATAHKELGNLDEAINIYKKVLSTNPNHTNSNYNIGLLFHKLKDLKNAKKYLKKTTEVQSNYAFAFFSLGNIHVDLKELDEAVSCYQKAIDINPNLTGAHNNLGLVFRSLNDFKNSIDSYKKALKVNPKHAGAHHNLALTYKDKGEFSKSIESHKAAIKLEPENLAHYHFLSELKNDFLDESFKIKIKKIISSNNSNKINSAYGNYLLSKYSKNEKDYENELNYLKIGHKKFFESRKEKFDLGVKYCFNDVLQIVEGAKVEASDIKQGYKVKPIFIVGVPRCGSTLLEKIIGSGKKLIPLGEETAVLENFVNAKILKRQSLNLGNIENLREELFSIYQNKGLISEKNDYVFSDKSLNNFFYLELIKQIYPNAKVINLKRDVVSSIMSIFQNNLTELAWTHDIENIFKYFDNYFKIVENFKKENSNFVYEMQFEELIDNPETESKKLMKFCELPWDKKCLEFYKRKDLVSKTASNIQIRGAIFKNKSDKYSPYKKLLEKYGNKYSWFK
jgi:tetratricopeptide (TPR) repeat protein